MSKKNILYGSESVDTSIPVSFGFGTIAQCINDTYQGALDFGHTEEDGLNAGVVVRQGKICSSRVLDMSLVESSVIDGTKAVTIKYLDLDGNIVDKEFAAFEEDKIAEIIHGESKEYTGDGLYIDIDDNGKVSLKYSDLYAQTKADLVADGIGDVSDRLNDLDERILAIEDGYVQSVEIVESSTGVSKLVNFIIAAKDEETGVIETSDVQIEIPVTSVMQDIAKIPEISNKVDGLSDDVEDLMNDSIQHTEELLDLSTGLKEAETAIAGVEEKVESLDSSVSDAISELNQEIGEVEAYVEAVDSSFSAAINELNGEVAELDENLQTLDTSVSNAVDTINAEIGNINDDVVVIGDALSNIDSSLSSAIEEIEGEISEMHDEINSIEKQGEWIEVKTLLPEG